MTWPGEALLIKLWETLAEKGIGNLLKPWQMRREALAQIEMKRVETVALAEADRAAEEIRSGRLMLTHRFTPLTLPAPDPSPSLGRIEFSADAGHGIEASIAATLRDVIRREINVAKAITIAELELKDDPQIPPRSSIHADWLFRWRDYAGAVSSEDLQKLWGRVLAGELKSPGSYSFRTLDFIKTLSMEEAKKIEGLAPFVIGNFIARGPVDLLEKEGWDFHHMIEMQDLGIISGVEALAASIQIKSMRQDSFDASLRSFGRSLLIRHDDPKKEFSISAFYITGIGLEILSLGQFTPNEEYLRAVGREFKKDGARVLIARCRTISEDKYETFDAKEI